MSRATIDYYPRCPDCQTNAWVIGSKGPTGVEYECIDCGRRFDA